MARIHLNGQIAQGAPDVLHLLQEQALGLPRPLISCQGLPERGDDHLVQR